METASNDPLLIKARVFAGCLNKETCTREDVIELFSMYGPLKAVTYFNTGGFAYVQYENIQDANSAVKHLNKFNFQGSKLNVKIANPSLQKPLNQAGSNQKQPKQQRQFKNAKQFPNKQQNQQFNAPQAPFNAFGTARHFSSNKTPGKGSGPPSKFATAANSVPLGGGGGFKSKKPMPQQQAKRPRFNEAYQQRGNMETQDYGSTSYDTYQGYQNPYGQIDYETTPNDQSTSDASQQQPSQYAAEGTYEEGEYIEGEYPEYSYDQAVYDQNYQYDGQTYYDEYGQPVEYAAQEGYEDQEFDYSKYQYVDGVYYDEYGQAVAYYPDESYENQEYDPTAYSGGYYDQTGLLEQPPNLEPPSKSRKAEFTNPKMKEPALKPQKQPAAVKELSERPIHYNYEVPDMFFCGGCHFCTANPQYFIQHRAKPCPIKQVTRGENEPEKLHCYMCSDEVRNSWDLLRHLGQKHCLYMFNETHAVGAD